MSRFSEEDISRFLAPLVSSQKRKIDDDEKASKIAARKIQNRETEAERQEREALAVITPSKSMVGVDESTTRVCADLSYQIYTANTVKDFVTEQEGVVTPLLLDTHGVVKATTPPFGVFEIEKSNTMILVWRGSMTKMDWVVDLAVAPVVSTRWNQVAPSLRAHAGYTSLVESDLSLHEEWLVEQIEKRNISQVIYTGHSLAGAMAQIAQVAIQGQRMQSGSSSPWGRVSDKQIAFRTIQFGAPMSCLLVDNDKESLDFWKLVGKTSCNIVYGTDMMPRAPGNFDYVDKAVRQALVPFLRDTIPIMSIIDLFPSAHQKLLDLYQDQTKKQDVLEIIQICGRFQHAGSIIYYASIGEAPVKLDDYQFRTQSQYQFKMDEEERYPNRKLKEDHRKFPAILVARK